MSNRGLGFEKAVVAGIVAAHANPDSMAVEVADLIHNLKRSHSGFSWETVHGTTAGKVKRKGSNSLEDIGRGVADIVLHNSRDWGVSIKDVDGGHFNQFGIANLFDKTGTLNTRSKGVSYLNAFGVDLNRVQAGYDVRNNIDIARPQHYVPSPNSTIIRNILQRAWGVNYFYARKQHLGWLTFWLDRDKLERMTSNLVVEEIGYPTEKSKSITIKIGNQHQKYLLEVRHAHKGEYPTEIKCKLRDK